MAKRILIVCDDPTLNTGYARVGRFVAKTLQANGYRVRYAPCNAVVPEVDRHQWPFELDAFNPNDRYYNKTIANTLAQYKPALVMVFGEFSFMGYIGSVCRQYGIQSLYYMPVEGDHYPPSILYLGGGQVDYKLTLLKFNYIVAYSEFGARNINALMPGIVTDIIPHQVDTTIFKPLDRRACLTTFFPNLMSDPNVGMDRLFIVGHVGRNQRRKGTDYVVQGFADFVARHVHPELPGHLQPLLFLTTDPKDNHGYNLYELMERYGLKGKVAINPVIGGKNGLADNQLAEVYNTFDVHLCPHRAEGFGLCIDSAADISMENGSYKKLKEVIKGDKVLAGDGVLRTVLGTAIRQCDKTRAIGILKGGIPELKVTPEHELLVAKLGARKPNIVDFLWRPAKDIKIGNWVLLTKPKWEGTETEHIVDLSSYVAKYSALWSFDEDSIFNMFGFSPKRKSRDSYSTMSRKYHLNKCALERACGHIKNETTPIPGTATSDAYYLLVKMRVDGTWDLPEPKRYKRYIDLFSKEAMYLFGWYIAEGSGDRTKFELSLGVNDAKYINEIKRCLNAVFGIKEEDTHTVKGGCKIRLIVCGPYGLFMGELLGQGAYNKQIPSLFFKAAKDRVAKLVEGAWLGDGTTSVSRKTNNYTTVSPVLASQLSHILKSFGIFNVVGKGPVNNLVVRTISGSETAFTLLTDIPTFNRKPSSRTPVEFCHDLGQGFAVRVARLSDCVEKMEVGDLWIEGVHSFTANNIIVHNSVLESLACGIRTVTTDYATPAEFGKDCCQLFRPAWMEPQVGTNCNWAVIDPASIGDALGKVYLMEMGSTKLQHNASTVAAQAYAEPVVAKKWLKLLSDLQLPELSDTEEVKVGTNANDSIINDYLTAVSE